MTVAELKKVFAKHKSTDVIASVDGWILIGPSLDECLNAWIHSETKIYPVGPIPEIFKVNDQVTAILPE